jgi:hypothetical protein
MVWLWSVTTKGSCVEGLIPNATVFKSRAFEKALNQKDSEFINGLNP